MDVALIDILSSYVPPLIARRLAENPEQMNLPAAEAFPTAVLLADITGFTPLTEQMAQRGPEGVETLSTLLNDYFSRLISLIAAHGGEVVKFAGDALLALWPADSEDELATATQRAAQCGLEIQAALHDTAVAPGIVLSLRIAVSAGETWVVHVGGILSRWEFTFAGDPFAHIGRAQEQTEPGEVILSPEAADLTADVCAGERMAGGHLRLESVVESAPPAPQELPPLPETAETALKTYIPGAIVARLAAGQTGWLAELRQVTVLFINLPDFAQVELGMLEQAQTVMRALQTIVYKYEGSINKLSVDDKGVNLVAAQGLPPMAHEDDAVRGMQTAVDLKAELEKLKMNFAVGVATGHVFCGLVGSDARREYTMIGDVVNMAARLMQAAPGDVLCDETTYQTAQNRFGFETLPLHFVKGKEDPVAVYRPSGEIKPIVRPQTNLVGRDAERLLLIDRMQSLLRGSGSVVVLEGEAGIGKSRLLDEGLQDAPPLNITTLVGVGSAIEKLTPYFAWRAIFSQYFGLDEGDLSPAQRQERVMARLQIYPDLPRLTPLLNVVLPLDMLENEITSQMEGQVRADNTQRLLVRLLQEAAESGPLMLALDDGQWMDSASWALLRQVSRAVRPLLIVLATRPLSAPQPIEYAQLLESDNARLARLDALPAAESLDLVCQRLGVTSLPEPAAAFIQEKAEGHPFFSEEMAYALRDAGLLAVENGKCRLAAGIADLHDVQFPDTVQGVITSRIDRLQPAQLLTLKVASVIGRVFEFNTLQYAYPIEADKPRLSDHLRRLERMNITLLEATEPALAYIFKHIITQEVAYNLMLFSQRQRLHRAVAEWFEQAHSNELMPFYTTLAYHWKRAGAATKAVDYVEKAAEQAMRDGAFREAVGLFCEAITLAGKQVSGDRRSLGAEEQGGAVSHSPTRSPTPLRRARWERQLGQAYYGLGKLTESRAHLQAALGLLNQTMPETNGRLFVGLLKQVGQLAWRRSFSRSATERDEGEREWLLEAATAHESLGQVFYYLNESLTVIYAAFRTLNLAELAGHSPQLAQGYANVGVVLGLIPLHRAVERYNRRALAIAEKLEQLPTLAYVWLLSGLYQSGVGHWAKGQAALERVTVLGQHLGDRLREGEGLNTLGLLSYYQGRFELGLKQFDDVYKLAHQSENLLHEAWAFSGKAGIFLRQGRFDEAVELAESALALLRQTADLSEEARCNVTAAVGKLRMGDKDGAIEYVDAAVRLINESMSTPTTFFTLDAYAGIAEVYLWLWRESREQGTAERKALRKAAKRAVWRLRGFARVFPFGQAGSWLYRGMWEWENGRHKRARRAWEKSVSLAQELNMPYEETLAQRQLDHCQ
ncbi:MAG: AAA family ATPase [Chloroflexi bacterium]|nr:AAA family ATPase [Chloroflexota bacterium]